jgi:hypothetical protein
VIKIFSINKILFQLKKCKFIPGLYELSATLCRYIWGSGSIASPFLTKALDGGEWLASRPGHFTFIETPLYPLDKRLREPKSRSERCGEVKHFLSILDIEPRLLERPARNLIAILIELSRLLVLFQGQLSYSFVK